MDSSDQRWKWLDQSHLYSKKLGLYDNIEKSPESPKTSNFPNGQPKCSKKSIVMSMKLLITYLASRESMFDPRFYGSLTSNLLHCILLSFCFSLSISLLLSSFLCSISFCLRLEICINSIRYCIHKIVRWWSSDE